jgi:hypothetical protein
MGPTAQDFSAAFGLGDSDTSIGTVDAEGVALAAIQGLYQIVQEKDAEIQNLKHVLSEVEASQNANSQNEIDDLKTRLTALERREPMRAGATPLLDSNAFGFGALLLGALALYRAQRSAR